MKVLVPIEDEFFGYAIADFITKHQWPKDTEIKVIHVVEPIYLNDISHAPLAKLMDISSKRIIAEGSRCVSNVAQKIQSGLPCVEVSTKLYQGLVADEIFAVAAEWMPDLVIVGSHGRKGIDRFMLGSVSLMLAQQAPMPVLIIKPNESVVQAEENSNAEVGIVKFNGAHGQSKIMIALDATDMSSGVIDFVLDHNWTQPAQFKLLTVVREPAWLELQLEDLADVYKDTILQREESLRRHALRLRDHYLSCQIEEELIEGDPKKRIVEAAEKWHADLIMLGSHCRSGFERFRLGSVALAVLCASRTSVLLLREKAGDKAVAKFFESHAAESIPKEERCLSSPK